MNLSLHSGTIRVLSVAVALGFLSSCAVLRPAGYEDFQQAVDRGEAIRIYDTLEALIDEGDDTRSDRKAAYRALRDRKDDTAEFHFAWAAVAGRFVQQKGLLAAGVVKDIEAHALRSRELDPDYRNGAATRLLGTLYVISPSTFVEHGNSELGLELLEGLVARYPEDPQNHLRTAEAYIALNDPVPAHPHLCYCLGVRKTMRKEDQKLLNNLLADAGQVDCPPAAAPAAR